MRDILTLGKAGQLLGAALTLVTVVGTVIMSVNGTIDKLGERLGQQIATVDGKVQTLNINSAAAGSEISSLREQVRDLNQRVRELERRR